MPNEPIEWAVLTLFGLLIYIAHVFERRLNKIEYRVSQLDGEPLDPYIEIGEALERLQDDKDNTTENPRSRSVTNSQPSRAELPPRTA